MGVILGSSTLKLAHPRGSGSLVYSELLDIIADWVSLTEVLRREFPVYFMPGFL